MVKLFLRAAAAVLSLSTVVATSISLSPEEIALDARAQSIVDSFTVEQVVGQMTQLDISTVVDKTTHVLNETALRAFAKQYVGSFLNTIWEKPIDGKYGWTVTEWRDLITRIQNITMKENCGHPMIYGLDSVHGANYVEGAVIFPQQINSAASFNPDLVYKTGQITAQDTLAAGIPWIFAPILDIAQNPLWARNYETFGEDPHLTSVMGDAIVRGLQSNNQTAACIKHFIAYSKTATGHDRQNVDIGDFDLLNYFMPPFKAAIDAGALSMMENYISINGEPVIANSRILKDLLRNDLKFTGFLVSDWAEINNLKDFHRIVNNYEDAVALSLKQTSLDMSMVPNDSKFIDYALSMLKKHPELESRLRESAKRIVKTKLKLGLYKNPVPGMDLVSMVGNDDSKTAALNMARESIVLLQNNDSVLPLPKDASVFLTGHSADDVGNQCGGWTKFWQGLSGNDMFANGISVHQGFEKLVGNGSYTYHNELFANGSLSDAALNKAVELAKKHKYTVVVIGESPYTEKPGDINDLALPEGQINYVRALSQTGTIVITVLFQGRPRLLGSIPVDSMAVINGMLPGELGGQAMAEIIFGDVNPSGRLPITYPKDPANVAIPYNRRTSTRCPDGPCQMQWNFGSGLSYTQFNYSNVTFDTTNITNAAGTVTPTVTVTNVGTRAGKETVMLFVNQPYRLLSVPEAKQLKKFKKIELQAGESMKVSFTLTVDDLSVYVPQIGKGLLRAFENTRYAVAIKPETVCYVYDSEPLGGLCGEFNVDTGGGPATINYAQLP